MELVKRLGVWMDHSNAILIDVDAGKIVQRIDSTFTHQVKTQALSHNESGMHHKEHQLQNQYYKAIAEAIVNYNKVLLFGPTDAKKELHNYLLKDEHYSHIKLQIKSADKMTDKEKIEFTKDYFLKLLQ